MANDDVKIIGDWGSLLAKQRTRASGKQRTTWEVQTDGSFMFDLSHAPWQATADAIVKAAQEAVRASTQVASSSSLARRQRAGKAYQRGERWAKQEYAGGRIGPTPPNQGVRYGIDSGRLLKSLAMRYVPSIASFVMNTAANRFGADFVARQPAFVAWFGAKIKEGLSSKTVGEGVMRSIDNVVELVKDGGAAARKKVLDAVKANVNAMRGLAGEVQSEFGAEETE